MPLLVLLGDYGIEGILGPGGVTETYLARPAPDAGNDGDVAAVESTDKPSVFALKLLRPDRIPEKLYGHARRRFATAAMKLRDFHRPGFAKVIEVSDDPSATFMITELVAGADLARLVEQQRANQSVPSVAVFDPGLVGLIGSQIARLLHVGHVAKPMLCHLGLCPQNVVVSESGDVTLLDAGIACVLRGITEQPPERWAFVAPELHNVDVGAVVLDERRRVAADLYSLGAILHFLLTAEPPPIHGQPVRADLAAIAGDLAAPLHSLLSPEPHERPESAQRVVDWLAGSDTRDRRERIAAGLQSLRASLPPLTASSAEEPGGISLPEVLSSSAKRSRRRLASLSAGLALALAVAAAVIFAGPNARRGQGPTGMQAPIASPAAHGASEEQDDPGQSDDDAQRGASSLSPTVLSQVAGHLVVETIPPGADVYVDGVLKAQTFADVVVGKGSHHVAVVASGHRMIRETVDTSAGAIIRRTLAAIEPPSEGNGVLNVDCRSGKLPIIIDERETGLLCPAKLIPLADGKHVVGIFVPAEDRFVSVGAIVEIGSKPAVARFVQ